MWESLLSQQGMQYKIHKESTESQQSVEPQESTVPAAASPQKQVNSFPKRALVNILLIILTSMEVVLIVNTQVYLHCDLLRSFLNFYADNNLYPELFEGKAFYTYIRDIQELQAHINFAVSAINESSQQSFINMNFREANISLQVQYRPRVENQRRETVYPIDPAIGIMQPFDSTNTTQLQQFLLDVRYFQIHVDNLEVENGGLYEQYVHRVVYHYEYGNIIEVNFEFELSNALVSSMDLARPQATYLIFLRVFYLFLLALSLVSFYFNATYIRRLIREFYSSLEKHAGKQANSAEPVSVSVNGGGDLTGEEIVEMSETIEVNIEARHITINNLQWSDYLKILDFDVVFSVISNSFLVVGNFYLLFSREHEIIVGMGCLFAWMTIFRILHDYKQLILMYELIKMAILRVLEFLISFLVIFMGYTFLGICLFPKVQHFCSISRAITTLAAMMAGDSISDITQDMIEKQSTILVILYIFSYIILFMHAIHNTLVSILKEYFILKKIQLLKHQKAKRGHQHLLYTRELPLKSETEISQLRFKMTQEIEKAMVMNAKQARFKGFNKDIRRMIMTLEKTISNQSWVSFDHGLHQHPLYLALLQRRTARIGQILGQAREAGRPAEDQPGIQ